MRRKILNRMEIISFPRCCGNFSFECVSPKTSREKCSLLVLLRCYLGFLFGTQHNRIFAISEGTRLELPASILFAYKTVG